MSYILVIWTIVAATRAPSYGAEAHRDWRPIGEFASLERCKEAAQMMNKPPELSRCLRK